MNLRILLRFLPHLALIAVLVVIAGRFNIKQIAPAKPPQAAEAPKTSVSPVPVAAKTLRAQAMPATLVARGRTEADRKVEVRAQTAGLVVSSPVQKGNRVKAGDVLCRIEDADRKAQLAGAKAKLAKAELDASASRKLSEQGFSTSQRVANDEANLQGIKAEIERLEIDIERTRIKAPFAGWLETTTAETGSLLQPGGLCATILTIDPLRIVAFVPERSVGLLELGQQAEVRLLDGSRFPAVLTFVARSGDEATRTFRIEATAANPHSLWREGMTAELHVQLPARPAHLLPRSALTLDDTGAVGVRLVTGTTTRFQPVEILRDGPEGIWVGNLPPEAQVILRGQEFVKDGAPISVTEVTE